jgi:hypothetical protein
MERVPEDRAEQVDLKFGPLQRFDEIREVRQSSRAERGQETPAITDPGIGKVGTRLEDGIPHQKSAPRRIHRDRLSG